MTTPDMLDRKTVPPISDFGLLHLIEPEVTDFGNGVRLVTIHDPQAQEATRVTAAIGGGYAEAKDASLPFIAAAQMREGTPSLSGAEISDRLDTAGATLESGAGAHHSLLTLTALNSVMPEVLPLLLDIVGNPVFPDDEFRKALMRRAAALEVAEKRNSFLSARQCENLYYGQEHPLTLRTNPKSVAQLTADDARRFHTLGRGVTLLAAGNLTAPLRAMLASGAESLAAAAKDAAEATLDVRPLWPSATPDCWTEGEMSNQASIVMAVPLPDASDPSLLHTILAAKALGGYFGSRLNANIREEKGYTYGITASVSRAREGNFMVISTECDRSYVEPVVAEINLELQRLADVPLTDDEITRLKRSVRSGCASVLENVFVQADYHIMCLMRGTSAEGFIRQQTALDTLTADDIARAARLNIVPARRFTSVAGFARP